jgi:hypothetical protein
MPVDLANEFTWPICCLEFQTTDAVAVVTVLADAPANGDAAFVSSLHVVGRNVTGSLGDALFGAYTIVTTGGAAVLHTHLTNAGVFGAGGLTIAVAVVGTELRLSTTGIALTTINWAASWRFYEFTP